MRLAASRRIAHDFRAFSHGRLRLYRWCAPRARRNGERSRVRGTSDHRLESCRRPRRGQGRGLRGGLAVAVKEAFSSYEGLWFGWSGQHHRESEHGTELIDRGPIQYAVLDLSPQEPPRILRRLRQPGAVAIMHYRIGLGTFSRSDYAGYQRVNQTFAGRSPSWSSPTT